MTFDYLTPVVRCGAAAVCVCLVFFFFNENQLTLYAIELQDPIRNCIQACLDYTKSLGRQNSC